MLAFRGHFVTKSRLYSTNPGEIRATRDAYRARQHRPTDDDDNATIVLLVWRRVFSGLTYP
jgi:hypothetical protein